jgi:hypothetical protein
MVIRSTNHRYAYYVWFQSVGIPSNELGIVSSESVSSFDLFEPLESALNNIHAENSNINIQGVIHDIAMKDIARRSWLYEHYS